MQMIEIIDLDVYVWNILCISGLDRLGNVACKYGHKTDKKKTYPKNNCQLLCICHFSFFFFSPSWMDEAQCHKEAAGHTSGLEI